MTAVDLRGPVDLPLAAGRGVEIHRPAQVLRETPPPSPAVEIAPGGPFAALGGEESAFANGRAVGRTRSSRRANRRCGCGSSPTRRARAIRASVRIAVRPGARLTLLESHEGQGAAYVANYRIELDIPAGAEVTRVVLVDEPADAISIAVDPGEDGAGRDLSPDDDHQRREAAASGDASGPRAARATEVTLDGLYALSGERHTDLTSVVRHGGLNGVTSQLTKGVVRDTARGVFQGKIVVERGADGTDARMGHHALILGERAEVDAKPELEIYADDVQCAHGNTVGNLDESALFYMQQRGIPADEARALLTQAFLIEVVDRIAHEGAREVVRSWLTARL